MLLGYLLCGLVVGWIAALASFLTGCSLTTMLGAYILGMHVGVLLGILARLVVQDASALFVRWQARDTQFR